MMTKYNTEKRKANVGERILITDAVQTQGIYANGDILKVKALGQLGRGVSVSEHGRGIFHTEYEVIVETPPAPKKSARITALETQVAELQAKVDALEKAGQFPNTARFERESAVESEAMDEILADIKRKAKPTLDALLATYPTVQPTPNEQRADVIKRAKVFVAEKFGTDQRGGQSVYHKRSGHNRVEFVVDSDKRTVVALLRMAYDGSGAVAYKGIAKCDPDDVFNADIGKAIALARALCVEVPQEFVNAVQPTEVVVGHVVKDKFGGKHAWDDYEVTRVDVKNGEIRAFQYDGMFASQRYLSITNDTDAVYE